MDFLGGDDLDHSDLDLDLEPSLSLAGGGA